MVRTFFFLLSFATDYETVMSITRLAFIMGFVSASILGFVGVRLAIRRPANGDASNPHRVRRSRS